MSTSFNCYVQQSKIMYTNIPMQQEFFFGVLSKNQQNINSFQTMVSKIKFYTQLSLKLIFF